MYRIIACDLDETLLCTDRTVSQKNIEAITAARKAGVRFVPATGRGFASVQRTLKELGLWNEEGEYVISFNGGAITENRENRLLSVSGMDFARAEELYRRGMTYDVCVHVYTIDTVYIHNINQGEIDFLNQRMAYKDFPDEDLSALQGQTILKVLYQNTDYNYLRQIQQELLDTTRQLDVSFSSNRYIEFNQQGVNKGAGLRKLAELLGVDIKDTIAIGDNWNDFPMIREAGLGIGVANTIADMKAECDHITRATCDEDAIAEVIYEKVLAEKGA